MLIHLFILQIFIECLLSITLLTTEDIGVNRTVFGPRGVYSL